MSDEEEEDWFERAVKEIEEGGEPSEELTDRETAEAEAAAEEESASEVASGAEPGETAAEPEREAADSEEPDWATDVEETFGKRRSGEESEPSEAEFGGLAGPPADEEEPSEPAGDSSGETQPPGGESEEAGPFGGEAEEPSPFGGTSGEPEQAGTGGGQRDEFGFKALGEEESGEAESGEPGTPGGRADFGGPRDSSFGGGGGGELSGGETPSVGGDEFGFGDFGEGGGGPTPSTDLDEEEFESEIDRIEIGIEGLDDMILGGVPERSLITTIGSAGTGKTTFALHFLHEALRAGENAVYITLEESREAILSTAEEKGWSFREYEEEGLLAVVAIDPIEMANSLASIRNDLSRLIDEFGAERLVLDSVSLLEMMYDHPAKRRSEVFDFTRSLKEAGVTTMLTSEASEDNPYVSRHGIVEYLTDAVFILQYVRPSDFRETRLAVEIQKIRDANHSRETKPYEITDEGISVYQQANIF
ncbi:KaiC domain-containing protein [Haloparvum sp. PAK95]|uniref:KaiC domain-containing protein n=1 Tax=Haloparvum sp. PAK95 TaxID=3418962 RepID=UPI003D2EB2FB